MINSQYKIWIEAEEWADGWDINNGETDVIVEFDNSTRWVASFFTYSIISKLVEKNKQDGECLDGKYYWSSDMLLVDEVSRERIEEIIKHLINEDEFQYIFNKCSD